MSTLHVAEGVAALAVAVSVIVGIVLRGINQKVDSLQKMIGRQERTMRVIGLLLTQMLPAVTFKEDYDMTDLSTVRSQLVAVFTDAIEFEERLRNPLSAEELARLKTYRKAVQQGKSLTVAEAQDMKDLAQRMAEDHPNEPSAAGLLVVAGLFLAIALIANKNNKPD